MEHLPREGCNAFDVGGWLSISDLFQVQPPGEQHVGEFGTILGFGPIVTERPVAVGKECLTPSYHAIDDLSGCASVGSIREEVAFSRGECRRFSEDLPEKGPETSRRVGLAARPGDERLGCLLFPSLECGNEQLLAVVEVVVKAAARHPEALGKLRDRNCSRSPLQQRLVGGLHPIVPSQLHSSHTVLPRRRQRPRSIRGSRSIDGSHAAVLGIGGVMSMRVLFTGATGVIGRWTVPHLIANGHEVRAVARNRDAHRWLTSAGAEPIRANLFEPSAVARAVDGVDAVVNMATAIPPQDKMTERKAWMMNDRIRSDATRILIDAAIAGGAERFIQQSISLVYADGGERWIDEQAAVKPVWEVLDSALDAESHVRRFTEQGGTGVTLRFSTLYGPGRVSEEVIAAVLARKMPFVGRGDNFVSHLHIADAATSISAALSAPAGTYNVSDEHPVPRREELRSLAAALQAGPPRSIPPWLARIVAGPAARLLTVSHRISAARFTDTTGWKPAMASVTGGWTEVVDPQIATPTGSA